VPNVSTGWQVSRSLLESGQGYHSVKVVKGQGQFWGFKWPSDTFLSVVTKHS